MPFQVSHEPTPHACNTEATPCCHCAVFFHRASLRAGAPPCLFYLKNIPGNVKKHFYVTCCPSNLLALQTFCAGMARRLIRGTDAKAFCVVTCSLLPPFFYGANATPFFHLPPFPNHLIYWVEFLKKMCRNQEKAEELFINCIGCVI